MNLAVLHNKIDNLIRTLKSVEERLSEVESELSKVKMLATPKSNDTDTQETLQRRVKTVALSLATYPFRSLKRLTITGALLGSLALITGYVALRYDISVSQSSTLYSSNPFHGEFVLTNDGPFAIYNISYICYFERIVGIDGSQMKDYAVTVPYLYPELHPHGQYGISCAAEAPFSPQVRDGVVLEMRGFYSTKFPYPMKYRGGALFLLKHNENGQLTWKPEGDVPEKIGKLKREFCIYCDNK